MIVLWLALIFFTWALAAAMAKYAPVRFIEWPPALPLTLLLGCSGSIIALIGAS